MNKELNLCELLKGCKGMEIYSLLEGITCIYKVDDFIIETTREEYGEKGEVFVDEVCLLYPSRDLYEKYPLDAYSAWMEWKSERTPKQWRAEAYDEYWVIDIDGKLCTSQEMFSYHDNSNYNFGNYFRTEEEAQQAVEAVRECLMKFHEKNSEK